jgi:Holliday junction resolvase RusA-like endonuclease
MDATQALINTINLQDTYNNEYSNRIKALVGQPLVLVLRLYSSNWMCKNGNIRKKDAENYAKATVDALFDALRSIDGSLDDSQIWGLIIQKESNVPMLDTIELELAAGVFN